jgi:hypothetical protein
MLFFYCFLQSKTFFNIQVKKKEKNQKKTERKKSWYFGSEYLKLNA